MSSVVFGFVGIPFAQQIFGVVADAVGAKFTGNDRCSRAKQSFVDSCQLLQTVAAARKAVASATAKAATQDMSGASNVLNSVLQDAQRLQKSIKSRRSAFLISIAVQAGCLSLLLLLICLLVLYRASRR